MNDKLEKIKAKKLVICSLSAFWIVFAIILITHILTGTATFRIDYSISKYVGLTLTSAIVFLLTNIAVSIALWKYLKPKLADNNLRIMLVIIVVMLVGLSLCPIHLFDGTISSPMIFGDAPISFLHKVTSRTMFVVMAAFALYYFYLDKKNGNHAKIVRNTCLSFFIYAMICIFFCVFFPSIFWTIDLIFESVYIAYFFAVVLVI